MYAGDVLRHGAYGGFIGHAVQTHDGSKTAWFHFAQIQGTPSFCQIGIQAV
ncbi:Uncharacterised protein [Mycobacteroides abscessus subsp. massiliense]|nr:Uncharacterised protein [Mycobacteroides abscessus subsp. massiliense]